MPDGGRPLHRLVHFRRVGRAADLLPPRTPGIKINRWFFYAFYPAHLAAIALMRNILCDRKEVSIMLTVKDLHKSYQVGKTTYEVLKGVSLHGGEGGVRGRHGPLRLRQDHAA